MIRKYNDEFLITRILGIYNTEDKSLNLPLVCDMIQEQFDSSSNNMMVLKVSEENFSIYVLDVVLSEKLRMKSDEAEFLIVNDDNGEPNSMLFKKDLFDFLELEKKIIQ